MMDVETSVVVPCYRSKATLAELVTRLVRVLRTRKGRSEIILVNDCSPDDTWREIERLAAEFPQVVGLDLMYNVGQFKATLCGLERAKGNIVVTLDDDLQHPPEEMTKLLARLDDNPAIDCVIGAYNEKKHGRVRSLGSRWYARLAEHLYGKPPHLEMTSFRAMRYCLAQAMVQYRTAKPFLETLILKCTSPRRILNVEVEHHPRKAGRSGYDFKRLARIVGDNIIGNSALPLHAIGIVGTISSVLGVLISMVWLLCWVAGVQVSGTPVVCATIAFFGGLILTGLGLIGEYLSRHLQEITGPPRYTLRQSVETDTQTKTYEREAAETVPRAIETVPVVLA